jgi:hypothetical protein
VISIPLVSRATPAKRVGIALVIAFTTGCLRAELRPTLPMRSHSEDVATQVAALNVGREREFVLRMSSPTPHRIRRAFLTVPARLPCQGGLDPLTVSVDGLPSLDVAAGEHEVRASFERDDFSSDLVLDLDLDEGRCVRTAVYSTSLGFAATSRTLISVSMPVLANTDLRGLSGIIGGQLGVGRWLGPVRLLGEVGVAGAYCRKEICGKDDQSSNKAGLAIPLSLQVTYRAFQFNLPRGTSFGMVGLRYSYVPLRLPTLTGEDRFAVHGIHADIGWGIVEFLKGNLRHLERVEDMELVLPVGVLVGPAGKKAFSAGIVVRFLIPI